MAVKFLKSTNVGTYYRKGEVAGFDARTEAKLIKDKLAAPVKATTKKAAPTKAEETKSE